MIKNTINKSERDVQNVPLNQLQSFVDQQRQSLQTLTMNTDSNWETTTQLNAAEAFVAAKQYGHNYQDLQSHSDALALATEVTLSGSVGLLAATSLHSQPLALRGFAGTISAMASCFALRHSRIETATDYAAVVANSLKESEYRDELTFAENEIRRRRSHKEVNVVDRP